MLLLLFAGYGTPLPRRLGSAVREVPSSGGVRLVSHRLREVK